MMSCLIMGILIVGDYDHPYWVLQLIKKSIYVIAGTIILLLGTKQEY
uniref:Uncharacterized protein n=1 Tax=Arundo donax TaxID=35708 RepID=A0A0A9BL17_ARUDO